MDILLNRNEIFRYLGYKKDIPDEKINLIIEDCIVEATKLVSCKYTYNTYDMEILNQNEIKVLATNCIFKGNNITKHLGECEKIVVMAATIGIQIDRNIKLLENTDMTKAVVFNAVSTTYIEELCDYVQSEIQSKYLKEGYSITNRYSPGYGDFNILQQIDIGNLLKTNTTIGLTITNTGLSIPFKSVTAIIGLHKYCKEDNPTTKNCKACNLKSTCSYAINS